MGGATLAGIWKSCFHQDVSRRSVLRRNWNTDRMASSAAVLNHPGRQHAQQAALDLQVNAIRSLCRSEVSSSLGAARLRCRACVQELCSPLSLCDPWQSRGVNDLVGRLNLNDASGISCLLASADSSQSSTTGCSTGAILAASVSKHPGLQHLSSPSLRFPSRPNIRKHFLLSLIRFVNQRNVQHE